MAYLDVPDDPELKELLELQHGVVSTSQLKQTGVSLELAKERVAVNRWQRLHRGTYAAFSGHVDRLGTIWAGILRCGPGAVASHQTAAELDGLCDAADEHVHVTIDAHRRVRGNHEGVTVHYAHRLPRTRHPTKSPPRTRLDETILDLIDVAATARDATEWIIRGVQRRLTIPDRLAEALALRKKIKWRTVTEAMLADVTAGAQSMLEIHHLNRVERAHGLPRGVRQRRVAGNRVVWVDVDYSEYGTRVELDGRVGHRGEGEFRDRRRDNRGTVGGDSTLRYGYAEVFGMPCDVAAEHVVVLQDRGWDGEPTACGSDCRLAVAVTEIRNGRRAA